jgi:competence protein ComEA
MSDPSPTAAAADGSPLALASPAAAVPATIVVDVEGAVAAPGIYTLATDSRVGDAIAAAGGYSPAVDIEAAAQLLNLAARLSDGEKVLVPRLGAQSLETPGGWAAPVGSATPTGLIDINLADQPALEMLPGVGPVTAAKIIAARNEAPFTSVDELLSRGVLGPATFEKVRPLVTVGQ